MLHLLLVIQEMIVKRQDVLYCTSNRPNNYTMLLCRQLLAEDNGCHKSVYECGVVRAT